MVKHLFKGFLENKKIYTENVSYWQIIVGELFAPYQIQTETYLQTSFVNGEPFLDGNPIYHFRVESRGVRIIQEEIEKDSIVFSAWIDSVELLDESVIDELVICLELSEESKKIALDLIQTWIVNDETVKNTKLKIKEIRLSAEEVLLH